MEQQQKILTFWDHLEELRHVLFRIAVAVVFLMLVAFLFKDELFAIVLAPKNADFIIYHFFCRIADSMAMPSLCPEVFYVKMINTQLAAQFITHMSVSFYAGFFVFLCTKLIPQTLDRNGQSIFIHIFCAICPDPVYKVSTGHGSASVFNKQTQ